jgi:Pentapeptide repeats (8 copies)
MRLAVRMGAASEGGSIPPHRWMGAGFDWLSSRPSALFHRSATARLLLEVIAGLAILVGIAAAILTAFQFRLELENREEDRVNRAWSLVAAAKEVQGNIGLIEALETLNARRIDMSRLEMPGAYLEGVQLEGGRLIRANLKEATLVLAKLSRAKLSQADLAGAKLFGAKLQQADLLQADLFGADLLQADLFGANLFGAKLSGANLSRANLSGAHFLTQEQLNAACGNEETKLPPGLTVPRCK